TSDVFSVSGQMSIVDGRAVLTGTGSSTYIGALAMAGAGEWVSASADVDWVDGGAGRARLQIQFRSGGSIVAAAQRGIDKSDLPGGGRTAVKGVVPDGLGRVIGYLWACKEGSVTRLCGGRSCVPEC